MILQVFNVNCEKYCMACGLLSLAQPHEVIACAVGMHVQSACNRGNVLTVARVKLGSQYDAAASVVSEN